MNRTAIEWCDMTWNYWTGCRHGCEYCYARKLAEGRLKGRYGYNNGFEPTYHPNRINEPFAYKKPLKIFVCSMGDLFGEWVPPHPIEMGIGVARGCPQHTFMFLTKNPRRYMEFEFPSNCWLGTSIADYRDKDRVTDLYMATKKHKNIRWLSIEPLHGTIPADMYNWCDWVVVGAETGNREDKIRPVWDWVADIIRTTDKEKIPIFMKNNLGCTAPIQEYPKVRE